MQFLDKAGVITIVNWIKNNYVNKTTVSIPSSIPSASFGSEILVGSVDGKQFKFKMPANPNVNTASLQVSDTTNKRINTSETTGNYIQFTGGTNKFTVGDGTNSFEVAVTPSITNNVTGTGTSGQAAIFNGAHTLTGRSISTSIATDNSTNLITEGAVKSYVDGATAGLSGAMHYIGTSTSAITDGGTENPTISDYSGTAKTAGNVVVYGSKEFVWNGTAWEEFGDEGSYALKTVSVTGTGALSGGGTLTENRTIVHNTSGVTEGTYGPGADVTGSEGATISVPEITVDEYGHVTAISNKTYTSKNTTYTALKNPNALNIGTKPSTSGTATNRVTYDGSASGKGLYFSSAAASNTNVQFAVDANGFVTGTVTESVNTDRYVNSAAFASQGTNGVDGTQMTLTRAGSDTQTVTATIPVATTSTAGVMSGEMVTKLNGIAAGAEANVQSDWNATSGDAMILNKPDVVTDEYGNLNIGTNTGRTSINAMRGVTVSDGKNSISLDQAAETGITITTNDGLDGTITLDSSSNIYLNTSGTNKAYYNNKEIATKDDIPAAVTESTVSGWGFTKNSGTVTSITPGVGLINGSNTKAAITTSGTVKVSLVNETANTADSTRSTSTDGGLYAVELDKSGKLAVRVPWINTGTVDEPIPDSELQAILYPSS